MCKRSTSKLPTQQQIRRAVASSTAIETGIAVNILEDLLKKKRSKFRHLELAK